ncbi:type VII secretion protein EccB [Corynebacterium sp. 35RC1]|nr:type VII secretion protein EccB [Corynebacterium sp. 35RC1]
MGRVRPTTKAQVSGHKFLMRRVELGLLVGDIRMIHDPIAARMRATVFGLAATVLLCLGAGALALLQPQRDPGDALVLASEHGQLYVRQEQTLFPVPNLTSARLIVGQPAQPAKASHKVLQRYQVAQPVGIVDAPNILAPSDAALGWAVCTDQQPRPRTDPQAPVLLAQRQIDRTGEDFAEFLTDLGPQQAIYATVASGDYLVTAHGRFLLPAADTDHGRILRRALQIPIASQRWSPPEEILATIPEEPALHIPQYGQLWNTDAGPFWFTDTGATQISTFQADLLRAVGLEQRFVTAAELAATPVGTDELPLPTEAPSWAPTTGVCVLAEPEGPPAQDLGALPTSGGSKVRVSIADVARRPLDQGAVALHGGQVATHFAAVGQAVAVATGNGVHVVSEHGQRHRVDLNMLSALGIEQVHHIPWPMLALLPEGTELSTAEALHPLMDKSAV